MNTPAEYIEIVEGTAYIKGRKLKVKMIAGMHIHAGASIEDVAEQYNLTLAEIYAALAYYYDNQAAFEQEDQELDAQVEAVRHDTAIRLERMREKARRMENPS